MAAEVIGGAFLSATLQVTFERLISHDTINYFRSRKLEEDLLNKLQITLISINQVLEDAEEMQYRSPNVKKWLDELKDAVYVADGLLDEIAIEAEKHKLEAEIQTTGTKLRNLHTAFVALFDKEIESRLKEVLGNLDYLSKQKDVLGLKVGSVDRSEVGVGVKKRLPTTSFVDEYSMFGRDSDKEKITDFLLSEDVSTKQPDVISIVGMGGVGKTSLAKLVYNDKRMEDQFELKAWVCVSEDFDVVRVTKLILEALHCSIGDTKDLNLLQHQMKERLMGKKFLLVLDDVWNESRTSWEALKVPFTLNSSRTKILVTTRSDKVASVLQSIELHHLKPLEEADCWKLFTRNAFGDQDASIYANLQSIGKKIVGKCKGLPLAIKTLGSLLQTRLSYKEWIKVFESDMWHLSENDSDIIPALRLSYHYLSSSLKRCFAYCSIFPKDYEINKEILIQLWMAEGLLQSCQTNKCAEELGNEFFYELESRSFFQRSQVRDHHFIMHDLLNDLAKSVSGEFCFRLEVDQVHTPKKVRHFSYLPNPYDSFEIFKPITNCHQLQTFIPTFKIDLWNRQRVRNININQILELLSKFKCLRVLSLSGYENLFELDDDICNLKHLRFLDLSLTEIKKLPDSICKLHNLQTLKLNGCLRLSELPSDLHKLTNLHHLEFCEAGIAKLPINIGRINHLRTLTSFPMRKHSGSSIKELGNLKHLQGRLLILDLENVIDPMDAMEAKMKDKMNLAELEFGWRKENEDSETARKVLEALQPHCNLNKLTVKGYGGTRFPGWLGAHCIFNLASLELRGSKYCFSLPSLGQLPLLKELYISDFDAVVVIGNEFYGDNSSHLPFRCLEVLKFERMREWEEWLFLEYDKEDEYFPSLLELHISYCPKLKRALPRCLPSLKKMLIKHCKLLEPLLPRAITLEKLTLVEYDENINGSGVNRSFLDRLVLTEACVQDLGFGNSLHYLSIDGGQSIMSFSLDFFPNIHCLSLAHCAKLVTLPEGGIFASKLEELNLLNLSNLKSLPKDMHTLLPSLRSLFIIDCEQLESLPLGGLPSSLERLKIYRCSKLIASRLEWGLHKLHSLAFFFVSDDFENVNSFPEKGLLPPNIKKLVFWGCSKLKLINYSGILHLKSLQSLEIYDCPSLQCLPEEGLPSSLSSLDIQWSPLLERSCQKEKGQDCHTISRIPHVLAGDTLMTNHRLHDHHDAF